MYICIWGFAGGWHYKQLGRDVMSSYRLTEILCLFLCFCILFFVWCVIWFFWP